MRNANQLIQKLIYILLFVFILNIPLHSQSTKKSAKQPIVKKINNSDFPEQKFLQIFTDAVRKSRLKNYDGNHFTLKKDIAAVDLYAMLDQILIRHDLKNRIYTMRDFNSISKTRKRIINSELILKSVPIENLIKFIYDIEYILHFQVTKCNLSIIRTTPNSDLDVNIVISVFQNEKEDNENNPLRQQSGLINVFPELIDFFPNGKKVYFEFKELYYSEDGILIYGKVKKENEIDLIINKLKKSKIFKKVQSVAVKKKKKEKEKGFLYKITLNDFKEKFSSVNSQDDREDEPTNNVILDWKGFQKILIPMREDDDYSQNKLSQLKLLRLEKLKFPKGSSIQFVNDIHLKSKEDILNAYKIFKNETTFILGIGYKGEVKEYIVYIVGKELPKTKNESKVNKETEEIELRHPDGVAIPINPQTGNSWSAEAMKQFQGLIEIYPNNSLIPRYLTPKETEEQDKKNKLMKEIELKRNNKKASKDELEIYHKNKIKIQEDRLEIINYLLNESLKEDSPTAEGSAEIEKKKDLIEYELNLLKEQRKKDLEGESK